MFKTCAETIDAVFPIEENAADAQRDLLARTRGDNSAMEKEGCDENEDEKDERKKKERERA